MVTGISDTTYTVEKLVTNNEYTFRVLAVNKAGRSPPSDQSDYLRIRKALQNEKPTVQEALVDTVITLNTTLTLSCIFGGVPEPTIKWYKDEIQLDTKYTSYTNRVARCILENTSESSAGIFKCTAVNEIGTAETSCTVTVQEKPAILIEEKYLSQNLRIDGEFMVRASVTGYPRPKVVWYKSKTKLESKTTTRITYEANTTELSIIKLKRSHTGKYVIEASNEFGVAKHDLNLSVIDKPTAPEGPLIVTTMKKDGITLQWRPPRDCGGLELTQYTVEKCDAQQRVWIKVTNVSKDVLTVNITKLTANAQYLFRVSAQNAIGESEPLESEIFTMRFTAEKPSPPRGPIEVAGMTDSGFVLSWQASESDGGSAILEYLVEMRQSTAKTWTLYGSTELQKTNLTISDLTKGTGYDFRIYARNGVGDSAYLESEEPIVVGRKISKYIAAQITLLILAMMFRLR